ncbi:MAG TPA: hypothetical protein VEG34_12905, partial [Thermoanaerobaculia bacterium]|nr:hypothetical protein [Thermoanaerobaculia bacterium]
MTDKLAGLRTALGGALRQLSDTLRGVAERPTEEAAAVRSALATLADIERAAADLVAAGADLAHHVEERERRCRTEVVEATTRLAGSVARSLNDLLTGVAVDTELALARLPETDPL